MHLAPSFLALRGASVRQGISFPASCAYRAQASPLPYFPLLLSSLEGAARPEVKGSHFRRCVFRHTYRRFFFLCLIIQKRVVFFSPPRHSSHCAARQCVKESHFRRRAYIAHKHRRFLIFLSSCHPSRALRVPKSRDLISGVVFSGTYTPLPFFMPYNSKTRCLAQKDKATSSAPARAANKVRGLVPKSFRHLYMPYKANLYEIRDLPL